MGGPLHVAAGGGGGVSLATPSGVKEWWGSFGGFKVCSAGQRRLVLRDIRYRSGPRPLSVELWVRRVSRAQRQTRNGSVDPFYSAKGRAPDFEESYVRYRPTGSFVRLGGQSVSAACSSLNDVSAGFTELVVSIETGSEGALVNHLAIDYNAGAKAYTRNVDWTLVDCGAATKNYCR